jgi:hypothetical protein
MDAGWRRREASAIHSNEGSWAGMDGCNEQRLLAAVQAGRANRDCLFCRPAGRPVAVAVAAAAKGVGKKLKKAGAATRLLGTYHCISAAAVAVVMSAGILLRRG